MRKYLSFPVALTILVLFGACKKENEGECSSGAPTIRQITDKRAVVKVTATMIPVYLLEENTIDTWLIPCNLPQEYFQHDLEVIISGDVKTMPRDGGPCCKESIIITKISK